MSTYVDTSTLLKLVVEEVGSDVAAVTWDSADAMASVGLVVGEGRVALAAAHRARRLAAYLHRGATREAEAKSSAVSIWPRSGSV